MFYRKNVNGISVLDYLIDKLFPTIFRRSLGRASYIPISPAHEVSSQVVILVCKQISSVVNRWLSSGKDPVLWSITYTLARDMGEDLNGRKCGGVELRNAGPGRSGTHDFVARIKSIVSF